MKYIIVDQAPYLPVVFPDFVAHVDMVNKFGGAAAVISAGTAYFSTVDGKPSMVASGFSIGLGKGPGPNDSHILTRYLLEG